MSWIAFVDWMTDNMVVLLAVTCSVFGVGGALVLLRWWMQGAKCQSGTLMGGKTVLITGANTGIGKETARDLARRGARVVLLCRDLDKARGTAEELHKETGSSIVVYQLDLASLQSVMSCAAALKEGEPKIHCLLNNAGVMMCPRWETQDGFEMQLGTNHLGHFLLTLLLLDQLKAAAPARIVNVSSIAHTQGQMHWEDLMMKDHYDAKEAYCQSKLANLLFTHELSNRLHGTGVTAYALHPGVVQTELGRHLDKSVNGFIHWAFHFFGNCFFKTVERGAQTSIYCTVEESIANHSGKYYSDCAEKIPHPRANDSEDAAKLWDISLQLVGLNQYNV